MIGRLRACECLRTPPAQWVFWKARIGMTTVYGTFFGSTLQIVGTVKTYYLVMTWVISGILNGARGFCRNTDWIIETSD
ncbi:hypothetical protein EDC01DRAFT_666470 [Geopyxis carbonaria]|nr:hypothetical protein EDC01DRAFT_666470 [Geopyxis carbonaria]